jgi:macrolide-specific efflux system membrane fusion protein
VTGQVGEYTGSGSASSASSSSSSASSTSSTSTTSGFVVLTDVDLLDVKVGFTETDAAKVEVGQDATITIDAIGGDTLEGTVVSLDRNQTVVNNVVTYYAKIVFDAEPRSAKPGMTASVSVVLDKREDVVTLPTAAVSTQGTTATVTVRSEDGTESQRTIEIGLRGDNAVEITVGLAAGETVVTRTTTGGGAASFAPPGGGAIGGGIGPGGP